MYFQPAIKIACCPPACRIGDGLPNDQSQGGWRNGLEILIISANIANMRKGKGDDLSGIGRIGQNFLIASHRCVETYFANIGGGGTESIAGEDRSIFKNEGCCRIIPICAKRSKILARLDFLPHLIPYPVIRNSLANQRLPNGCCLTRADAIGQAKAGGLAAFALVA